MKALVYGDGTNYHCGCEAVVDTIRTKLADVNVEVIATLDNYAQAIDPKIWNQIDAVIINGEGSMHSLAHMRRNMPITKMQLAELALKSGKFTALLNNVWQDMSHDWDHVLKKLDMLTVRELKSYNEITKKHGATNAKIFPDLSYYSKPTIIPKTSYDVMIGDWPKFIGDAQIPEIENSITYSIMRCDGTTSWDDYISQIKACNYFITGRHHSMYAAILAETPFALSEGNTWKNSGLMDYAGSKIPVMPTKTTKQQKLEALEWAKNNPDEYTKLFEFLKNHEEFSFVPYI